MYEIVTEQGFEAMYRAYFPKIYNYVFYRVLSREIAEDIVSTIFMKIARSRSSFDEKKASFNTWIYRIAKNALTDYYRSRKIDADLDQVGEAALSVCFEEQMEAILSPQKKALYQLLSTLTERERMIIYYRFFEEKTNRQIAMLLEMNESTVGTVLSRALKKLKLSSEDILD